MFDIGFWELSLIAVILLLVVGPERMPRVARTAGLWFGKARGFLASVKADVDRELKAEELKDTVKKQAESSGAYDIFEETKSAVAELQQEQSRLSGDATAGVEDEFGEDDWTSADTGRKETATPPQEPPEPTPDTDQREGAEKPRERKGDQNPMKGDDD
ncbi:MAG TPA: Sec-independent protein translocase protein TatB [Gammaproteobacteria bacterium]|nr:Sec-independent protein translocase protein TatB [Gammaproteobacteria bacterium]